jgi:hypothetical protein
MNVESLKKLAPLVSAYELIPGRNYVVLAGKGFSYELAHALFKDVRENHPDIGIFVIVTPKSKNLEIAEGENDAADPIP